MESVKFTSYYQNMVPQKAYILKHVFICLSEEIATAHVMNPDPLHFYVAVVHNEAERNVFSFASYYQNNMVLQQAPQKAHIWGYASMEDVDSDVLVTINDDTVSGTVETGDILHFIHIINACFFCFLFCQISTLLLGH